MLHNVHEPEPLVKFSTRLVPEHQVDRGGLHRPHDCAADRSICVMELCEWACPEASMHALYLSCICLSLASNKIDLLIGHLYRKLGSAGLAMVLDMTLATSVMAEARCGPFFFSIVAIIASPLFNLLPE